MLLGTIQKASWGAPGVPMCNTMHPREGLGTPAARPFREIDAFRRPRGPNLVPGGIQNQSKNMIKIVMETDAEKVLQKVCKSI